MKTIIVDDEPKAINLLLSYIKHFSSLELKATFRNGLKAFEYISKESVDLVFLDINMPHISGITLSKMLPASIHVIFTTAYSEYAAESYEIQAVDYLMKPISLERFTQAVSRVLSANVQTTEPACQTIHVKSGFETFRINASQLVFLEKQGNYMIYHCSHQKIRARETISEALGKLPSTFVQTHKSFIVNIEKIERFTSGVVHSGTSKIPVGDNYRDKLFEALKN